MFKNLLIITLLLLGCLIQCRMIASSIDISVPQLSLTYPYSAIFSTIPIFAYYIQSGSITNPQFSMAYLTNQTILSSSGMNISFICYVNPNQFTNGGILTIRMLLTNPATQYMSVGVLPLDIASSTLSFSGFSLSYNNSKMEIYPLAFPMIYTKIQNSTTLANNQIVLSITSSPSTYMVQGKIYFAYIYFTNIYSANTVIALYQGFSQSSNSYQFSYASFAFTPSQQNILLIVKSYSSFTTPFFNLNDVKLLTSSGSNIDNFSIGYIPPPLGVTYMADAFIFNSSFRGCPLGQYLYYLVYFSSLPYSCQACDSSCGYCFPPNISQPNISDANSCSYCPQLRYLNKSNIYNLTYGSCPCDPGTENNGTCEQCRLKCLSFKVVFIQTTNQSNFLLYFSYPSIVEKISIDQNLVVKINEGNSLVFEYEQTNDAVYMITLALDEMSPCEKSTCQITFQYQKPEMILKADESKSLSNSRYTVKISNYVNYYNLLPGQLKSAFQVLGMVMLGTYSSGYTSLFKILLELQQLIDAHKYLNLTLPIIYNTLVQQLQNFKFLDLSYLLPQQTRNKFTSFVPTDLDQFGSPQLIYYQQGVNFFKNIITGFISLAFMLAFNYLIYLTLKLLPLKLTRLLAKKINKRKIITIHDSLDQLVFPVFFYSITNFSYFLLKPYLIWIYAFAAICGFLSIAAPFFVVFYVYLNRKKEHKIQIFEDLLQDNTLSQTVTYVYYIFNYYRKIFFALCLTDTLPGIVQIYLLICLNTVHLAFQLYLIIAKTYKSKSKVIVRLINSLCIIAVQILIIAYNLSWYDTQTLINIGLSCFYLSITTALLNIIDAFIKLLDTIFQEINEKKRVQAEIQMFKQHPVLQQFSKQFICNLGKELQPPVKKIKDPKQLKFQEDKQLMENTFHVKGDEGSDISDQVSEAHADKSQAEQIQIVFIDDDWTNVYPIESDTHLVEQIQKQKNERKMSAKITQQQHADLYQIPEDINKEVEKISRQMEKNKKQITKKTNKYEAGTKIVQQAGRRTPARKRNKTLQIRPIEQTKVEDQEISEIS